VDFADIMNDRRTEPSIAALAGKITIAGDDSFDERGLRQSVGSITSVTTHSGATFVRDVAFPIGAAENPLSDQDLERKFTSLTADVVDAERADRIKAVIADLETLADINDLTRLLEPV
jgi:2-methylcitrate dehydratase PrpD